MPAYFLPGWLEGGVDTHLILPGCLEDGGGALSLPRCKEDDGAGGGAGGGVREAGVVYPFPACQGEGGWREGGTALDLNLVCEDAGLNPP